MVCLLPRWRRRGQPSTPCALVDGGVRRGGDILKALALGARAVLVGRPYWWGLAAGGARGVSGVIDVFRNELDMAMALSGSRPSTPSVAICCSPTPNLHTARESLSLHVGDSRQRRRRRSLLGRREVLEQTQTVLRGGFWVGMQGD